MQQIQQLEGPRRQLGAEDDLELMVDHDQHEQIRELKNKIIFSFQGLGGVRTIKHQDRILQAYIKGPHCEQSVKDLVKFIRQDVPSNPRARLILSDYNIVESDLLQLLVLQVQDKKLSFWLIALLALLTGRPSQQLLPQQREKLMGSCRDYKKSFIKKECFQILMVHISDYYHLPADGRLKVHMQMLEFIILLIRNLAQISSTPADPNLHNHFLAALLKQDMFDPLFYIIQNDRTALMHKLDIPLLQILFHTLTCFDPAALYTPRNKSLARALAFCKSREIPVPSRHSRFLPTFMVTNDSGVNRVSFKLGKTEEKPLLNQRKMPVRMTQYKKVAKLQLQPFGQNFMRMQIQIQGKPLALSQLVLKHTRQFLQVQLQLVIKLVFDQIFRETGKVSEQNIMQYLLLCSWALQSVKAKYCYERAQCADEIERCRVELQLGWIVDIMQNSHFELIYKLLFTEVTRQKRKHFKINLFNAAIRLFHSYLDIVDIMANSMNMLDRKNANVLMANVFRHDIARIIRHGFVSTGHEGILSNLIVVAHKFFKLLAVYADGRVLTIQTNRLLKRKKKRHDSSSEDEREMANVSLPDLEGHERQTAHDQTRFQERKYNEKSEFAILAQYAIISKYLLFLRDERFAGNGEELNEAIFFYLLQIKKLLNGEWLFYQAETICIFQKILAHHEWAKQNREKCKFVSAVCLSFIRLLRRNPLALLESLFRYGNLSLKQHILKNYAEDYEDAGEHEPNMFTDQ